VLAASGCKQELHCPELGECGGDLVANWAIGPDHPSCSEDLYIPPTDKRLDGADLPAARLPAPEPAFSDWCGGLIAWREDILYSTPLFYTESAAVGTATVRYNGDGNSGTYDGGFGLVGTYLLTFSAACMRTFGAFDGRPPPDNQGLYDPNSTEPPVGACKQLEGPLRESGIGEGAYRNVTCDPNPEEPEGCLCFFDRAEVAGFAGVWTRLSGNEILHTPTGTSPNFTHRTKYCRSGNELEVTGADGAYLFGMPGLRTLTLGKTDCTDGVQGFTETGIDCGGVCGPCAMP
jgi:hypothetical protein